jgi:hypothetical protein
LALAKNNYAIWLKPINIAPKKPLALAKGN